MPFTDVSVGDSYPLSEADGILPTPPKGQKFSAARPAPIMTDPISRSTTPLSSINTPSSITSTNYVVNTPICFSSETPLSSRQISRSSTWSVAYSDSSPKYGSRFRPSSVPTIHLDKCLKRGSSDFMNSFVNPEAPSPPVYLVKTKACRHFARGYCAFGDKCAFAHTVDELRVRPPNLCKTKLCDRGRNCRRPNCGYAHSKAELFHIEPDCPDIKGADDAMSDYYQDLQYIEQLGVMYAAATEKHDKV